MNFPAHQQDTCPVPSSNPLLPDCPPIPLLHPNALLQQTVCFDIANGGNVQEPPLEVAIVEPWRLAFCEAKVNLVVCGVLGGSVLICTVRAIVDLTNDTFTST